MINNRIVNKRSRILFEIGIPGGKNLNRIRIFYQRKIFMEYWKGTAKNITVSSQNPTNKV
jgi:hypothetical protein